MGIISLQPLEEAQKPAYTSLNRCDPCLQVVKRLSLFPAGPCTSTKTFTGRLTIINLNWNAHCLYYLAFCKKTNKHDFTVGKTYTPATH